MVSEQDQNYTPVISFGFNDSHLIGLTLLSKHLQIGQGSVLQNCDSLLNPIQVNPPPEGAGLEQFLVWDWVPLPQDFVHVVHADQVVQFPSEKK